MNNPACIIAGTNSGAGKTTISLGIMAAFKARGLAVQPFKSGPDFIDPTLHSWVCERRSRNLDLFMMEDVFCRDLFARTSASSDISIIEGVMGMFDGDRGSSYALAQSLDIPVILVINAKAMAQSAAAMVKGFEILGRGTVHGVIANNIASPRHLELVRDSITQHCDAQFLGHLPSNTAFAIPSRHLGLHLASDQPLEPQSIDALARTIEEHIDLDGLMAIAEKRSVSNFSDPAPSPSHTTEDRPIIAVARDQAFCFYYQDNFELLEQAGAKIHYFSPLADKALPKDCAAIILSGGYPELYGAQLSENREMRKAIKDAIEGGMPCYAECGGFMYLCQGIHQDDQYYPMVGIYGTDSRLNRSRASLGYREISTLENTLLGPAGTHARGHEFHYSTVDAPNIAHKAYAVERGNRGHIYKNCLSSYIHLHFGSNPQIADNFIKFIQRHSQE